MFEKRLYKAVNNEVTFPFLDVDDERRVKKCVIAIVVSHGFVVERTPTQHHPTARSLDH